jgi:hypothetical protein
MAPGASQTPTQHDHNDDHDDAKLFSHSHDDAAGAVASRPGSPISSSSSSERDDHTIGANYAYDPNVLRARAAAPSARPGAPCRSWESNDARPANEAGDDDEDADTEPTDDDEQQPQQSSNTHQNQQSSPPPLAPTPPLPLLLLLTTCKYSMNQYLFHSISLIITFITVHSIYTF